jgi:hypothetical protein
VEALRAPVACVPDKPLGPLQPPDATQSDAFVEAHVRLADADFWTVSGETASETEGGGDGDGDGDGAGAAGSDEAPPPHPKRNAAMIDNAPRNSGRTKSRFKSASRNTQDQPINAPCEGRISHCAMLPARVGRAHRRTRQRLPRVR